MPQYTASQIALTDHTKTNALGIRTSKHLVFNVFGIPMFGMQALTVFAFQNVPVALEGRRRQLEHLHRVPSSDRRMWRKKLSFCSRVS